VNEALRQALTAKGLHEDDVAESLSVDRKTVERWLAGRLPYPRYRELLADLLGVDESLLWPQARRRPAHPSEGTTEVQAVYPHRWAVPRDEWRRLFESAEHEIAVLVYAGLFLAEDLGILRILADRARAGVAVRILLGNPDSPQVARRGADEGVDDAMAAKIRNALVLYRPLCEVEGIEIRLHETILYASLYRADDDLLVNPHAYGVTASHAPVLHITHADDGDMASTYLESFERIWLGASPVG